MGKMRMCIVMDGGHWKSMQAILAALILFGQPVQGQTIHEVMQINLTFSPPALEVAPGDTIRWIWTSGNHTVTTGINCTFDGVSVNQLLDDANPTVEFVVPLEMEGEIPYFCLPHCFVNMVGTFTVVAPAACPSDVDGNDEVDVLDLLQTLSDWGACPAPCPSDSDGNGAVDVLDLLSLLSAWGGCP